MTEIGTNSEERIHRGQMTKIDRYGWTIKDGPGEFAMLRKSELHVDNTYQRDSTETKVQNIARNWSWIACGAISVSMRDGTWWVIDGQHRVLAARRRADIQSLPCMIFETSSAIEEASGFLNANVNRKSVDMIDKFRALRVTEDPVALKADELIERTGRVMSKATGPTTINCPRAVMRCIEMDEAALRRIWPLMIAVCEGHTFHSRLLEGLCYLEHHLGDDRSLTMRPWRDRLKKIGFDRLQDSIHKASAFYSKGGAKVWAMGIAEALNHGMKNNRISIE